MDNYIRYKSLVAKGIVTNRSQLDRLIGKHGFPVPIELSDHAIAWKESAVDAWLETRERRKTELVRGAP